MYYEQFELSVCGPTEDLVSLGRRGIGFSSIKYYYNILKPPVLDSSFDYIPFYFDFFLSIGKKLKTIYCGI